MDCLTAQAPEDASWPRLEAVAARAVALATAGATRRPRAGRGPTVPGAVVPREPHTGGVSFQHRPQASRPCRQAPGPAHPRPVGLAQAELLQIGHPGDAATATPVGARRH